MTEKKLIINTNSAETRVALLEDDILAEISIERADNFSMVGNIYKAKVGRVLPGMQSAFLEIGQERSCFLYGGDVIDQAELTKIRKQSDLFTGEDQFQDFREKITGTPIEKLIKPGQDIMVQVSKDPIGTKGARVTTFISLPGRYLVLMPFFNHTAISRRIEGDEERSELLNTLIKMKPDNFGLIIRTAALEATPKQLQKDLDYLLNEWNAVLKKMSEQPTMSLLYQEPPIHVKSTRDLYSDEISEIVVDNEDVEKDIKHFLASTTDKADKKVRLHEGDSPIFDDFGIEVGIARALGKKVWLPSGGYLIIDQAEALTAFDVNTGRFVGKVNARETILKTNLEALKEIVAQLRLRNLGGIIVLDFIDMESHEDRQLIYEELELALKNDKARTNVLEVSELGLVQMTRKRTSESLEKKLTEACPHCNGNGYVRTLATLSLDLIRDLHRHHLRTGSKTIDIVLRKDLQNWLFKEQKTILDEVCRKYDLTIRFDTTESSRNSLTEPLYEIG